MPLPVPPSTGKKKDHARRVFGTSLLDGVEESLCYSYSEDEPSGTSLASTKSINVSKSFLQTDQSSNSENRVNNSAPSTKSSSPNASKASVVGPFDKIIESEGWKSKSATPTKMIMENSRIQEKLRVMRIQNTKSPVRRNLVKATQDAINQAAISVNESLRAAYVSKVANHRQVSAASGRQRRGWNESKTEAKTISQLTHEARLQAILLEKELSSHLSRDKAKRKQSERSNALREIEKETEFKSQHFREQQRRLKEDKDYRRRKSMAARALLRANYRQGKVKLQLRKIVEEKANFEDRHESSIALRTYSRENNEKRRMSFAFRNGDARRIRELHAQLEAQKLESEHENFQRRRAGDKDAEAYKHKIEAIRRESLAHRNEIARKQRELSKELESESMAREHESYELKWAGEKDAEAYKTRLEEERRKSFARRGEDHLRQRLVLSEAADKHARTEHETYELKWSAERDAEAYQRQLQDERRESLEQRNLYANKQREQGFAETAADMHHEHESYELKWAGEKDVEQYLESQEKERRESFALRNNEGKRHRELEERLRGDALSSEHLSYELKWDGERDAKAYELRVASERRQSLQDRNGEGRKRRELESKLASLEATAEHASYELNWAGEKDADAYKRLLQQERRESFAFRNKEGVRHATVMAELRSIAMEKEHESYALKWAGESDAKVYIANLEQQRRESLQLRGKQKLHEMNVQRHLYDEDIKQMHEHEDLRAADQKDIEQYRKDCAARDRASLEFRRKEARAQRISKQIRLLEKMDVDSKNFRLESDAHRDVEEYLKDCKRRRRLSLAFRARERRVNSQWQQKQDGKMRQDSSEQVQAQLLDRHYIELAQQQERARIALKSMRRAGLSRETNSS